MFESLRINAFIIVAAGLDIASRPFRAIGRCLRKL